MAAPGRQPQGRARSRASSRKVGRSASRMWSSSCRSPIDVPASGVVDYTYVVIPTEFTEDKWVQFAEARPDARSAMHHVLAFLRPPGNTLAEGCQARRSVYSANIGARKDAKWPSAVKESQSRRADPRRNAGRFRSRSAAYPMQARRSEADQGRLRHRFAAALHAERESGNGPQQGSA